MILTYNDILKLLKRGYRLYHFAYFDGNYWRLRNFEEKCVFLNQEGRCLVYDIRPLGCQAYPVIVVEKGNYLCCELDNVCPYAYLVSKEEFEKGCDLLKLLFMQLGEKIPERNK